MKRKGYRTIKDYVSNRTAHRTFYNGNKDWKEFSDIADRFHIFIKERLLDGDTIDLPKNCGRLKISSFKIKPKYDEKGNITNLPVDYKATKDLWARDEEAKKEKKLVRHLNFHSDGFTYFLDYTRKNMNSRFNKIYSFEAVRDLRRGIAKLVKNNNKDYA